MNRSKRKRRKPTTATWKVTRFLILTLLLMKRRSGSCRRKRLDHCKVKTWNLTCALSCFESISMKSIYIDINTISAYYTTYQNISSFILHNIRIYFFISKLQIRISLNLAQACLEHGRTADCRRYAGEAAKYLLNENLKNPIKLAKVCTML